MSSRKIAVVAAVTVTAFLLAGCIRYEGNVAVNPSGTMSGRVIYALDKRLAAVVGITSLESLKSQPQENEATNACDSSEITYSETATEFIIECLFTDKPSFDENLSVRAEGDTLILNFKQVQEPIEPNGAVPSEYGSVRLDVSFPGPITTVNQSGQVKVDKVGERSVSIAAKASDSFNVDVIVTCPQQCREQKATGAALDAGIEYAAAPRAFGGLVTRNLVFKSSKEPYRITKSIQIPEGKYVRVEPGATLEFQPRGFGGRGMFDNLGTLIVEGTERKPVRLSGENVTYFHTYGNKPTSRTYVSHAVFTGGYRLGWQAYETGSALTYPQISNSTIIGLREAWPVNIREGNFRVERNTFINSAGLRISASVVGGRLFPRIDIRNNRVIQTKKATSKTRSKVWIEAFTFGGVNLAVTDNDLSKVEGRAILARPKAVVNAKKNFWGSTDPAKIRQHVEDGSNAFPPHEGAVDIGEPLTAPPSGLPPVPKGLS